MGQLFRCYWIPALLAEELPENDCPPVRVKLLSERLIAFRDSRRSLRPDRRVLRPSRRVAVVRPQRGVRPALPLSRLEIRRDRPVRRGPVRAERKRLRQQDQAASPIRWSSAAACCGPIWARPRGSRRCRNGSSPWCRRSRASCRSACRNATGCRRWRAASIPATCPGCIAASSHRSAVQGREGQPVQYRRRAAGVRGGGERRRPVHRRAPQRRERPLLLAHHAMGDAVLHHDRAARRPPGARPLLDADRRRELLGLELRLPSDARADRGGSARRCEDGKGMHVQIRARHLPPARQQGQRLSDRPRRPEGGDTYSGVDGIAMQDASLQESMGPIIDRTKENLVSTDNGIIMARHRLMRAAKALSEKGNVPPGVDPAHQRVRSAAVVLPPDRPSRMPRRGTHGSRRRRAGLGVTAAGQPRDRPHANQSRGQQPHAREGAPP